ncbi:Polymerase/histidinol phosphatase-like protein [Dissophora ornata]|nr:Polymerase/histidinol phosphatase-like protein [Dissophora ornata]
MAAPKKDGSPDVDHILLIPSSQSSTPSIVAPSTFQDDLSPFNPTHTTATANNNGNSRTSSTPSLSLSHRGSALPLNKPSTSSSIHKGDSPYLQPQEIAAEHGPSYSTGSFNDSTTREHGSKTPLVFQRYIKTPFQSFQLYLATPIVDRQAHAAAFPQVFRHIPPWLFPQYHQGQRRVLRSTVLRPLGRLLLVIVILAVLIASTLVYSFRDGQPESVDYAALTEFDWTPINPRSYLSPWNATFGDTYDVLLDGHSHSIYSDGRMAPETLLKWHIANGYNALIVSDHNTIDGGLAAQEIALANYSDQITVIPAMELSCCRLHMNLIGINETIDIAITKWPTDEQLKATIDRTHELGGLAIINHIPWSNTTGGM